MVQPSGILERPPAGICNVVQPYEQRYEQPGEHMCWCVLMVILRGWMVVLATVWLCAFTGLFQKFLDLLASPRGAELIIRNLRIARACALLYPQRRHVGVRG